MKSTKNLSLENAHGWWLHVTPKQPRMALARATFEYFTAVSCWTCVWKSESGMRNIQRFCLFWATAVSCCTLPGARSTRAYPQSLNQSLFWAGWIFSMINNCFVLHCSHPVSNQQMVIIGYFLSKSVQTVPACLYNSYVSRQQKLHYGYVPAYGDQTH